MVPRDKYLNQLVERMNNGKIKVVTGIRRCGKSVLINEIFYDYLIAQGIPEDHIIRLSLEDTVNAKYRNPIYLDEYIRSLIINRQNYYVLLDEIQNVASVRNPWIEDSDVEDRIGFPDVLLSSAIVGNNKPLEFNT